MFNITITICTGGSRSVGLAMGTGEQPVQVQHGPHSAESGLVAEGPVYLLGTTELPLSKAPSP